MKVLKQDKNLLEGKKYAKFNHYGTQCGETKEYGMGFLYVQTHFYKVDVLEQHTFINTNVA